MNVIYNDKAKQWGKDYDLLQQAIKPLEEWTNRLDDMLGSLADPVSAEWDRTQDARGRPLYTLTISDPTGRVSATFTPAELRSNDPLLSRLRDLWGDLLEKRSAAGIKKLRQLVEEGLNSGQADAR